MTPLNISYYLCPNDYIVQYVPFHLTGTFCSKKLLIYIQFEGLYPFNRCLFIYICMWNLSFHKENSNTWMFHFIHFTNEYSPTLYHYYNLLLYIPIYIQHFPRENQSSWLLVPTTYLVSIHFSPSWSTPSSSGIC